MLNQFSLVFPPQMALANDITPENASKTPKNQDPPEGISVLNKDISFDHFFQYYLLPNQPCIIRNIAGDWESTKHWVAENKSAVDFKYLTKNYGASTVLTYDCKAKYYNSHKTERMSLSKYLQYWEEFKAQGYPESHPLIYLKDWHLKNTHPDDYFYQVPSYFSSDWLNEYLVANKKDDYRFVYMGPKGTWTPFHADVFKSYSWSVNILGTKQWIFLPPGEENHLKDRFGGLPHDMLKSSPKCKHFNIVQHAGDAIFVPSGWYHQVVNAADTISINHNWLNGCNINLMYLDMQKHLDEVKAEIADCKDDPDFVEQCHLVLNASYGMDYIEFLNFIAWIGEQRMSLEVKSNLVKFDLRMIRDVLDKFMLHPDVRKLELLDKAKSLYTNVQNVIKTL